MSPTPTVNLLDPIAPSRYLQQLFGRAQDEAIKAYVAGNLTKWLRKHPGALRPMGPAELDALPSPPKWLAEARAAGAQIVRFAPSGEVIAELSNIRTLLLDISNASRWKEGGEIADEAARLMSGLPRITPSDLLAMHDGWFERRARLKEQKALEAAGTPIVRIPDAEDPLRVEWRNGQFWVPIPKPWLKVAGQRLKNCLAAGYYAEDVEKGKQQVWGLFDGVIEDSALLGAARLASADAWRPAEFQAHREISVEGAVDFRRAVARLMQERCDPSFENNFLQSGIVEGRAIEDLDRVPVGELDLRMGRRHLIHVAGRDYNLIIAEEAAGKIQFSAQLGKVLRLSGLPPSEAAERMGEVVSLFVLRSGLEIQSCAFVAPELMLFRDARIYRTPDLPLLASFEHGDVQHEARLADGSILIRRRAGSDGWHTNDHPKRRGQGTAVSADVGMAFLAKAAEEAEKRTGVRPALRIGARCVDPSGFATRLSLEGEVSTGGKGVLVEGLWVLRKGLAPLRLDETGVPAAGDPDVTLIRVPEFNIDSWRGDPMPPKARPEGDEANKWNFSDSIGARIGDEVIVLRHRTKSGILVNETWDRSEGIRVGPRLGPNRHRLVAALEASIGARAPQEVLRPLFLTRTEDGRLELIQPTQRVDADPMASSVPAKAGAGLSLGYAVVNKALFVFDEADRPLLAVGVKGAELSSTVKPMWVALYPGQTAPTDQQIDALMRVLGAGGFKAPGHFTHDELQRRIETLGWVMPSGIPFRSHQPFTFKTFRVRKTTMPELEAVISTDRITGIGYRQHAHPTDTRAYKIVVRSLLNAGARLTAEQRIWAAFVDTTGALNVMSHGGNRFANQRQNLQRSDLVMLLALREICQRTSLPPSPDLLQRYPWVIDEDGLPGHLHTRHPWFRLTCETEVGTWKATHADGNKFSEMTWTLRDASNRKLAHIVTARLSVDTPTPFLQMPQAIPVGRLILNQMEPTEGMPEPEAIVASWRALQAAISDRRAAPLGEVVVEDVEDSDLEKGPDADNPDPIYTPPAL